MVNCAADGPRYLLLRVYRYWDFPKGEIARGEDALAAALREVDEETGLNALEFRWGEVFAETPPYSGGKVARYYVAHSDTTDVVLGINPELGRAEHHEFRWVDFQEARDLLGDRVGAILQWAHGIVAP